MDKEVLFLLGIAIAVIIFLINIRRLYETLFIATLILIPFSHMPVLPRSVLGVQGLSVTNIIWVLMFVVTFGLLILIREKLYLKEYFSGPILILLLIYYIAALRTIVDLDSLKGATSIMPAGRDMPLGLSTRILNDFIKPMQIVLVGWMVLVSCHLKGRVFVGKVLIATTIALGFVALFVVFKGILDLGNFDDARMEINRKIGMHANMLGRIALALFLSILFFKGEMPPGWRILSIFMALMIVGVSMSRACYAVVLLSLLLYYKDIPKSERRLLFGMVGVVVVMLSGMIVGRITYGIDEKQGNIDVNALSASRVDRIWAPLVPTIKENILVGVGLHGVRKSSAAKKGEIFSLSPHSSYVQLILDAGLVGVALFLGFMFAVYRGAKEYRSEIYYLIIPVLILGVADPTFYPKYTNYYFYILYGLFIYDQDKKGGQYGG
ncbi:MAG TPA: hypothetical protein EYH03_02170 [Chromatiales bacterium]|nr:hypothetical protein [Chromatiales bacterium]